MQPDRQTDRQTEREKDKASCEYFRDPSKKPESPTLRKTRQANHPDQHDWRLLTFDGTTWIHGFSQDLPENELCKIV